MSEKNNGNDNSDSSTPTDKPSHTGGSFEPEAIRAPNPNDRLHVLRLVEYFGPRHWIEDILSRSINGNKLIHKDCYIRGTTIGTIPPFSLPVIPTDASTSESETSQPHQTAVITRKYIIGLPKADGKFNALHGPFDRLQDALSVLPEYGNEVIYSVEPDGSLKSWLHCGTNFKWCPVDGN